MLFNHTARPYKMLIRIYVLTKHSCTMTTTISLCNLRNNLHTMKSGSRANLHLQSTKTGHDCLMYPDSLTYFINNRGKHWLRRGVWSAGWRTLGRGVDQGGHGGKVCKRIAGRVIWTGRMLRIMVDGGGWWRLDDGQHGGWVSVSSDTGSPG